MREHPEQPIFGPETPKADPPNPPRIKASRSIAKAISWRTIGTLDTLILSYLLITYLGPMLGLETSQGEAVETATYIAVTEVATKMVLYFLHERLWSWLQWGTSVVNGRRKELYRRSTTKTATWRTIASLDTMILAYIFTGNIGTAISIGGLEIFTKLILYFIHERVWSNIGFGIVTRPSVPPPTHEPLPTRVHPAKEMR
ncbi:MAG: DUF2061 domain-containing protein [Qipengyuania sp.]